jgi:hypothetical protein
VIRNSTDIVDADSRHQSLDGVILNGLQAVKDLARIGRDPALLASGLKAQLCAPDPSPG